MIARLNWVLIIISLFGLAGCGKQDETMEERPHRPVYVIPVTSSTIAQSHYSGTLEAGLDAQLAFRVPGTIENLYVDPGDQVSQGQELARLDPHDFEVLVAELEQKLKEAKAAEKLARIELERVRVATAGDAIAAVNLDRAQSAFARSKAGVKVVERNLQKAKDALRYSVLKAPFDGVVAQVIPDEFEQVAPGLPVIELIQSNALEADIQVPEHQIENFSMGTTAIVTWDGAGNSYAAKVTDIDKVPHPLRRTFKVTLALDEQPETAVTGRAVRVSLNSVIFESDVYCIPLSTLKSEAENHSVFRVVPGATEDSTDTVEQLVVEIQDYQGQNVCVSGALTDTDMLVSAGVAYLESGQPVGELIMAEVGR